MVCIKPEPVNRGSRIAPQASSQRAPCRGVPHPGTAHAEGLAQPNEVLGCAGPRKGIMMIDETSHARLMPGRRRELLQGIDCRKLAAASYIKRQRTQVGADRKLLREVTLPPRRLLRPGLRQELLRKYRKSCRRRSHRRPAAPRVCELPPDLHPDRTRSKSESNLQAGKAYPIYVRMP